MTTLARLSLRPSNHGTVLTLEEFLSADYQEGSHYELMEGKPFVSPLPPAFHGFWEKWISRKLDRYSERHPEVINYVHDKARVFVPGDEGHTCPKPDVTAFKDFPITALPSEQDWREANPVLVVEILSDDNAEKDLVRNVKLYLQIPSIREYWILDTLANVDEPRLLVYRRRGQRWQKVIEVGYGETYTSKLLPDFELILDRSR